MQQNHIHNLILHRKLYRAHLHAYGAKTMPLIGFVQICTSSPLKWNMKCPSKSFLLSFLLQHKQKMLKKKCMGLAKFVHFRGLGFGLICVQLYSAVQNSSSCCLILKTGVLLYYFNDEQTILMFNAHCYVSRYFPIGLLPH